MRCTWPALLLSAPPCAGPWFLAVGFIRPHLPFNSPAPFYDAFAVAGSSSAAPVATSAASPVSAASSAAAAVTPSRVPPPPRRTPPRAASALTARSLEEGMTEVSGNFGCRKLGASGARAATLRATYAAAVSFADAQARCRPLPRRHPLALRRALPSRDAVALPRHALRLP